MIRILALILSLMLAGPAVSAVRFADWSEENVQQLLAETAAADRLVMVVITQPDWCPGCIELDRTLLRNPEATEFAELTRDWLVMEVFAYDAPGAAFIASQGVGFLGTPTTLLLKPRAGDRRLGEARQVAAIVGFPPDYAERLAAAAAGHDAVAEAQAKLRELNDVPSLQALAAAFLAAGDAPAARRVYQSLLLREELTAEARRAAALESIVGPTQRVEKDHRRALEELARWVEAFPEGANDPDYLYARAWSLLSIDDRTEALELLRAAYMESDDADMTASYLYLAFRSPTDFLLAHAEERARGAILQFPEQAARFHAAHGRLLRRQGRLEEAEAAFARAVEGAGVDHPSHGTYLGQLEFVRKERSTAAN
jgi:thiol-disulfide isomerase/thioredoxin